MASSKKIRECAEGMIALIKMRDKDIEEKKKKIARVYKGKRNMGEKNLEEQIILNLNLFPHICCGKTGETANYNGHYVLEGQGDILGFNFKDKYFFYMEVKTENGEQRDTQVTFEMMCRDVNLKYFLVRSLHEALECVK